MSPPLSVTMSHVHFKCRFILVFDTQTRSCKAVEKLSMPNVIVYVKVRISKPGRCTSVIWASFSRINILLLVARIYQIVRRNSKIFGIINAVPHPLNKNNNAWVQPSGAKVATKSTTWFTMWTSVYVCRLRLCEISLFIYIFVTFSWRGVSHGIHL